MGSYGHVGMQGARKKYLVQTVTDYRNAVLNSKSDFGPSWRTAFTEPYFYDQYTLVVKSDVLIITES